MCPVLDLVGQHDYHRRVATKRKDFTQIAFDVVRLATGEVTAAAPSKRAGEWALGRAAWSSGRPIKMTAERRKQIAAKAAATRWGRKSPTEA